MDHWVENEVNREATVLDLQRWLASIPGNQFLADTGLKKEGRGERFSSFTCLCHHMSAGWSQWTHWNPLRLLNPIYRSPYDLIWLINQLMKRTQALQARMIHAAELLSEISIYDFLGQRSLTLADYSRWRAKLENKTLRSPPAIKPDYSSAR